MHLLVVLVGTAAASKALRQKRPWRKWKGCFFLSNRGKGRLPLPHVPYKASRFWRVYASPFPRLFQNPSSWEMPFVILNKYRTDVEQQPDALIICYKPSCSSHPARVCLPFRRDLANATSRTYKKYYRCCAERCVWTLCRSLCMCVTLRKRCV